eukprot:6462544-Amphidinium_carterae.2
MIIVRARDCLEEIAAQQDIDDDRKTGVEWGAERVAKLFSRRLPRMCEVEECSRIVALRRVEAAACAALKHQEQCLEKILNIVARMKTANAWRPRYYVEHVLYDETPLN